MPMVACSSAYQRPSHDYQVNVPCTMGPASISLVLTALEHEVGRIGHLLAGVKIKITSE